MKDLLKAAERLVAVVGHHGDGPPPAGIVVPFHEWQDFVNIVKELRMETENPVPVSEPEPMDMPGEEEDEGEDEQEASSFSPPKKARGRPRRR